MQPPARPRTFLVANIVDPTQRLFVSKSILDDALPPVPFPLFNLCNAVRCNNDPHSQRLA